MINEGFWNRIAVLTSEIRDCLEDRLDLSPESRELLEQEFWRLVKK